MITKKMWFKSKRYGWGWTPSSWEGWAVLALYIVGIIYIFDGLHASTPVSGDIVFFADVVSSLALTLLLILVCYLTGEKPRFRWGK